MKEYEHKAEASSSQSREELIGQLVVAQRRIEELEKVCRESVIAMVVMVWCFAAPPRAGLNCPTQMLRECASVVYCFYVICFSN